MAYRPPTRAPRNNNRRREKAKVKGRKRRHSGSYIGEEQVPSSQEVTDRALNRLRILGNQRFVLPPFSEHFDRWLLDIRNVLSEFETSPNISVDDQFVKERTQILSNVELDLEERRHEEAAREEAIKSFSDTKIFLKRIEEEYTIRAKEIERRKDDEVKRLSSRVADLKEELDRLARTKTGILWRILRKAGEQKETEVTQTLESAQREYTSAVQYFIAEQERLRNEYDERKKPITEKIKNYLKEAENQETDSSLEIRQSTCEALVNTVNAFLQRSIPIRKS